MASCPDSLREFPGPATPSRRGGSRRRAHGPGSGPLSGSRRVPMPGHDDARFDGFAPPRQDVRRVSRARSVTCLIVVPQLSRRDVRPPTPHHTSPRPDDPHDEARFREQGVRNARRRRAGEVSRGTWTGLPTPHAARRNPSTRADQRRCDLSGPRANPVARRRLSVEYRASSGSEERSSGLPEGRRSANADRSIRTPRHSALAASVVAPPRSGRMLRWHRPQPRPLRHAAGCARRVHA